MFILWLPPLPSRQDREWVFIAQASFLDFDTVRQSFSASDPSVLNFSLCLQLLLLEDLFLPAATDQHWVASFVSGLFVFFYHPFLFFCEHVDSSLKGIHHLMVRILVTGSFI